MNKTEKVALRESIIIVVIGAVINFPLQTYLLWLTIDNWRWSDPLKISIFIQIITIVALIRVYTIRMRFQGKILVIYSSLLLCFVFLSLPSFSSSFFENNHVFTEDIIYL